MMTGIQKILLACSAISFILTLYAFMFQDFWILIIFFIIQTISLTSFAYFCFKAQDDQRPETIVLREELEAVKADLTAARRELETQDRDVYLKYKQTEEELSQTKEKLAGLEEELKKAEANNKLSIEAAEKDLSLSAISSILPDFSSKTPASTLDMVKAAKDAAHEFHDGASLAGLSIQISSKEETMPVKADPKLIRILFRNIIDNSIKYMRRHGTLVITLSRISDELFIVLKDTGEGLAEEETRHIFELNYQGSNRISGNGLGLFQAKAIVEYYGGTIYAKSTPGNGMGIYIELPGA